MSRDIRDLCMFAAGFSPAALTTAIATALETQFPAEQERNNLASLVAAWLRAPEGDPPPLSADAIESIHRHLTGRVH
jgi:hypothetical protein